MKTHIKHRGCNQNNFEQTSDIVGSQNGRKLYCSQPIISILRCEGSSREDSPSGMFESINPTATVLKKIVPYRFNKKMVVNKVFLGFQMCSYSTGNIESQSQIKIPCQVIKYLLPAAVWDRRRTNAAEGSDIERGSRRDRWRRGQRGEDGEGERSTFCVASLSQ